MSQSEQWRMNLQESLSRCTLFPVAWSQPHDRTSQSSPRKAPSLLSHGANAATFPVIYHKQLLLKPRMHCSSSSRIRYSWRNHQSLTWNPNPIGILESYAPYPKVFNAQEQRGRFYKKHFQPNPGNQIYHHFSEGKKPKPDLRTAGRNRRIDSSLYQEKSDTSSTANYLSNHVNSI